jgi:prefoldin subunit 5
MSENKVDNNIENCSNAENNTSNKSDNNIQSITSQFTVYNLATGAIFKSNACNRITDSILIIFSIGGFGFGLIAWFTISNITAIGYILSGIFSSISLFSIKKMRLRASLQSSVNTLKEENDELKENNEELQENIDELEDNIDSLEKISKNLKDDLTLLKESIGMFGENSDEIMEKLREIYINLKAENELHESLNKNMIYLHILHIIKHFDSKSQFILNKTDLEKAKNTLLNAFPNLNFKELKKKMKNNKINAEVIYESVQLK